MLVRGLEHAGTGYDSFRSRAHYTPIGVGRFNGLDFILTNRPRKSADRMQEGNFHRVRLANLSHASGEKPVGVMPVR